METQGQQYDVFISHAYDDKESFADRLAETLKERGLRVWYSGWELKLGDSIADNINKALNCSVYGVIVISPAYISKYWAMSELKALLAQEITRSRILPVLHGITVEEARIQLPILADRYAVSTGKGLQEVVNKILEVVKGEKPAVKIPRTTTMNKKKRKAKKKTQDTETRPIISITGGFNMSGGQWAAGGIINEEKKK